MSKKQSVALNSVFASVFMTITKLIVGLMTGSMGILSEAAHSALDMGAAILTYGSVKISDRPADESHPYGHGKVESVSALIETGLLFVTSAWVIIEATQRLRSNTIEVQATWYAFAVIILSLIIDISRSRVLRRVAKETGSQALEADALHFSSDILSSAVVLIGLVFVRYGIMSADAIAAIGVSVFIAVVGYRLGKRTIDVLVDAAPAGIAEHVKEIALRTEGVLGVPRVRVRTMGPSVFADIVVHVSRKNSLEKVGVITHGIEESIRKHIPEADVMIHTKPVQNDGETTLDVIQILASEQGLFAHNISVENFGEKRYVSYDLEVPEHYTVEKAHQVATQLEERVRDKLGNDTEIDTHIDPFGDQEIKIETISKEEEKTINDSIRTISQSVAPTCDIHDIRIRKSTDGLSIALHCSIDRAISLIKAHDIASNIEYSIKKGLPHIKRAIVHIEPSDA